MAKKIIIFSGMPASGKDTITEKLCSENPNLVAFKKHRSVDAKDPFKDTYYNINIAEFEQMIAEGKFLQYHCRYGRYYGIADSILYSYLSNDLIPIIHIGRIQNYYTFCENLPKFCSKHNLKIDIIHVQLWETWDTLCKRIVIRDKTDEEIKKRKDALSQEFEDGVKMMNQKQKPFTLVIKNGSIDKTCRLLFDFIQGKKVNDGYDEYWNYLKEYEVKHD